MAITFLCCSCIKQSVSPRIICDPKLNESKHMKVIKLAISGGIAGGIANAVTFPIDTLKIMRQTDVSLHSILDGFNKFYKKELAVKSKFVLLDSIKKLLPLYSGFYASVLGSIPSSAIYFGTYESTKILLYEKFNSQSPIMHTIAATCGNILSSIVFVPKEAIKSQLQAYKTGSIKINIDTQNINLIQIVKHIYNTRGIKGFYPSYRATLMRNIPSAICRFVIYEEIRKMTAFSNKSSFKYIIAGSIASGFSSLLSTPIDVIKTRIATGVLPPDSPIFSSIKNIYKSEGFLIIIFNFLYILNSLLLSFILGLHGLFSGASARIFSASIFGGIGFTVFESMKQIFNIDTSLTSVVEEELEKKY